MEDDIKKDFYSQNGIEFFVKDIGTVMPAMLYTLAILGVNPKSMIEHLDYDLYEIDKAAASMEKEINALAILAGNTEEKASITRSMPDLPLDNTPVDRTTNDVNEQITIVSIKTSTAPQVPC